MVFQQEIFLLSGSPDLNSITVAASNVNESVEYPRTRESMGKGVLSYE